MTEERHCYKQKQRYHLILVLTLYIFYPSTNLFYMCITIYGLYQVE